MDNSNIKSIFEDAFKNKTKVITEEKAKDILISYDIKVPRFALVKDIENAVASNNAKLIISYRIFPYKPPTGGLFGLKFKTSSK